ncbi:MAG: amino acid adenylation domain-containing protein, partial [Gammaproteobacteria bacterium]|nr:amino acid adenylation domain-containing protein [Gammaproteobacteria bacterium]
EDALTEIWADVLNVERVGIHDDFFALGGHSLLAMHLISRIRDALDAELPLVELFSHSTVAELAGQLQSSAPGGEIAPCNREQPLPMSYAQQRLWFLYLMEPESVNYNVPFAIRLHGSLDRIALQTAVDYVVARHESLRTTFSETENSSVQLIAESLHIPVEFIESAEASDADVRTKLNQLILEPFDLHTGPLLRVQVLELRENEHILLLSMHHIICDAWSQGLLYSDLAALYRDYSNNRQSELPELAIHYADYAVWQRKQIAGVELEQQVEYWKDRLDDAPPLLNLPLDKPRPPVEAHAGAARSLQLDKNLASRLDELAVSSGCTLFVVMLAALNTLLYRYSGEDDLVIGTPISGRQRSELEGIVGFFLNTLAIRADMSGNPSFNELLNRVKDSTLGAFAHQELPFEKLVEELQPDRNLSHAPIFQVLFVLNHMSREDVKFGDLEIGSALYDISTAKFDLQLTVSEVTDGLATTILYNTDLFEEGTVDRMLGHYSMLLEEIVARPESGIDELALLDDSERQLITADFNNTSAGYPGTSLGAMVEAQATRTRDAIAIESADRKLSYAELNSRANRLARKIIAAGAGQGSLVGICTERCMDAPVAILAVLKAGSAYVPIDPDYPVERVRFMLEDSQAPVLITQSTLMDRLGDQGAQVICLDEFDWDSGDDTNLQIDIATGNPAYAIYTSGSTGQPKGVLLQQEALVNLLHWQQSQQGLKNSARTLQFASLSFDVSFQELFSTWQLGGSLIMIDEKLRRDLPALARFIVKERVERLFLPYAALQPLVECILNDGLEDSLAVQDVIVAGEQLQITPAIRKLFSKLDSSRLHNHYGPSETHVVTALTLQGPAESWMPLPPIGKPVANTQIYILDKQFQPVPIGVPGELYIGGSQVAIGYLNRDDLTAEKFVKDPFSDSDDSRLFRTGDSARFRADGNIDYLGRTDDQVKLRGFRIEPGEIETILATHPQVQQAAVLLREDSPGDKRLVAYLVPDTGEAIDNAIIRTYAKDKLPDYMVPSVFIALDSMPLTPSGKVARRKLPEPENLALSSAAGELPHGPHQKALALIWQRLLKVKKVSLDDNFFEMGGHSLMTIKLIHEIEEATGEQLSIADVFENPTIREFSLLLENATWINAEPAKKIALARFWDFISRRSV